MIEVLTRLTLLLLASSVTLIALRHIEPTWKLAISRSALLAGVLLLATALIGPTWKLPIWQAAAASPAPSAVASITTPESVTSAAVAIPEATQIPTIASASSSPISLALLFAFIWATGAFALLFHQTIRLFRHAAETKTLPSAPESITQLWTQLCSEFGVSPTRALIAPDRRSPHLSLRGDLILPIDFASNNANSAALVHVLRHEACHLRAQDHRWFPLVAALRNLFWFHPLAWWLNARHLQACEDARDAESARIGGTAAYRATIAQYALEWTPVRAATPCWFRKRGDLLRRLEGVQRTAELRPASTISLTATWSLVALCGIVLGGVILVPRQAAADAKLPAEGLVGSWRALDLGTDYFKQVDILTDDDVVFMKLWHSTGSTIGSSPTLLRLPASVEQIQTLNPGDPPVEMSHDSGFKTTQYALSRAEEEFHLGVKTHYTDDSGRKDRLVDLHYIPGTYQNAMQAIETAQTSAEAQIGWLGSWRNQDTGSRGTLQLLIHESAGDIEMGVWGRQSGSISEDPISSMVLPLDLKAAKAGANEQPVIASQDHGFCTTTYTMELKQTDRIHLTVKTDYVDPERYDQEFLWIFERGEFVE